MYITVVFRRGKCKMSILFDIFTKNIFYHRCYCRQASLVFLVCFEKRLWVPFLHIFSAYNNYIIFFLDHKWGLFSLIPNLLSGYGWNPGNKMLEWFGKTLEEATGNADITFQEVEYLCISLGITMTFLNFHDGVFLSIFARKLHRRRMEYSR